MRVSFKTRSLNKLVIYLNFYIFVLIIHHYTQNEFIKQFANLFAGVILVIGIISIRLNKSVVRADVDYIFIFLVLMSLIINVIYVTPVGSLIDVIKFSSLFVFYLVGKCAFQSSLYVPMRSSFFFMVAPFFIYFLDVFIFKIKIDSIDPVSIFANRNNAVLFGIIACYLLIFNNIKNSITVAYIIAVVLIYKTLGALIAAIIAICFVYISFFKIAKAFPFIMAGFVVLYFVSDKLEIFDRVNTSYAGILAIIQNVSSLNEIKEMSYADAALIVGSSDISFFFRIKHWLEILDIIQNGTVFNFLFGFGANASIKMTEMMLVPHNDYLRVYFEYGLFPFLFFILMNFKIIKTFGRSIYSIPAVFLFVYFFTENLINNFLVMVFFYFIAGVLVNKKLALLKANTK